MPDPTISLGNQLFRLLRQHQAVLFDLGRSAQLSYIAFQQQCKSLEGNPNSTIKLTYPIGLNSDGSVMSGENDFQKSVLINHYLHLAEHELGIMCTYHLVTQTEALLTDLATAILNKFPKKLGSKKQISISVLFEAPTLEVAREVVISNFCNELGYLSPKDHAEAVKDLFGFSLLEIPSFHKYLELKATRDVFIHNRGIANAVYQTKASSHSRAANGNRLQMHSTYFLQGYESCLKLTELMMAEFNEVWPSEEFNVWKIQISRSKPLESQSVAPAAD